MYKELVDYLYNSLPGSPFKLKSSVYIDLRGVFNVIRKSVSQIRRAKNLKTARLKKKYRYRWALNVNTLARKIQRVSIEQDNSIEDSSDESLSDLDSNMFASDDNDTNASK